jgi:hypothetical protein
MRPSLWAPFGTLGFCGDPEHPLRLLALQLTPTSDHSLRGDRSRRKAGISGRNFHAFRCEGNN